MKSSRILILVLVFMLLPGMTIFSQVLQRPGDQQGQEEQRQGGVLQRDTPTDSSQQDREGGSVLQNNGRHRVTITSNINGADVYINDRFMGETPLTVDLESGKHAVRVQLPRFRQFVREITVNGAMTVNAELLRRTAQVIIEIPEEGLGNEPWFRGNALSISIDGERIREESVEIAEGSHTIELSYGNLNFEDTFEVTAGRNYIIRPVFSVELEPQGQTAR